MHAMKIARLAAISMIASVLSAGAQTETTLTPQHQAKWPPEESLIRETQAAIDRAVNWLAAQQQDGGHWSDPQFPALTALSLWGLVASGWNDDEGVAKARDFIISRARPDGAIFSDPGEQRKGGGLLNYNTAICMVALHKLGDSELVPVIQRARAWLAKSQHLTGGDVYYGGMGYDAQTDRAYADLSNSYIAFEAMRLTEDVEDLRPAGEKRVDLDWEAATKFVESVQNNPEVNKASWVADDLDNIGGFAYHPENTRAGTFTNEQGVVKFSSFGSMSYAGMLSYIYANVDRDDPRVQSTYQWVVRHWNLDENVGTGREGLYYYYNVMAKGLNAFGRDVIHPAEGEPFVWRTELIKKLLSAQRIDPATGQGYWKNEDSRYWEGNPVLVTAYTLIALQYALGN